MRYRWFGIAAVGGIAWAAAFAQDAPPPPPPPPQAANIDLRQVQVRVWISEAGEQGLRDLGTNLNYTRFVRGQEQSGSVERITTNVFDPQDPEFTVTVPRPDNNPPPDNLRPDQNPGDPGVQTQSGAGLTFSIIDTGRGTIDGVFRSIENKSDVDLVSKPELLVRNNQVAEIHAGGEVPFQDLTFPNNRPKLNVSFRQVGVTLRLRPLIMPDNSVMITIGKLDVSDVARIDNSRGVDLPVFSTRSQTGAVVVPNGENLVIGGLSSSIVRKSERRVPILGSIPVLGFPFLGRRSEAQKTTLLIFISPTVVDLRQMPPDDISAVRFWREWGHRERIDREVEIMSEEL